MPTQLAHTLVVKPSSKVLMWQVSRKSGPNPPNVESRCILANYIKPRGTWIWGGIHFLGKEREREREREGERDEPIVTSSSD